MSSLKAALRYARLNLPVIPIQTAERGKPGSGKAPLTRHGYKDGSTDRRVIKDWFRHDPVANLGIVPGKGSNVVVLDVDPRNGGSETLQKLEHDLGKLPRTWTAKTGGGGVHLYFEYPDFTISKDSAGKLLGTGIDVIGEGGYVVAPPSRHSSGHHYRWRRRRAPGETKLARLPRAWRKYVKRQNRLGEKSQRTGEPIKDGTPKIGVGARNTTLTGMAGTLRRAGLSLPEITAALKAANISRCSPPLDDAEVEKIANSITRYSAHDDPSATRDVALGVARYLLKEEYDDGKHLLFAQDGQFWQFSGRHWEPIAPDWLKRRLLRTIEKTSLDTKGKYDALTKEALSLLRTLRATQGDPLRFIGEPRPILNCRNGEVVIGTNGDVRLREHRPKSYLRHCLDVTYAPDAECPEFDKAINEIFSKAEEPASMVQYFYELMGYIIQPTRRHAIIPMLMGTGNNGKTKLIGTIRKLLGSEAVYAGKIQELTSDRFAIGSLLGKQMYLDDDVEAGIKLADGVLKKISEEKEVTGELKYKDKFNFTCRVVPVLLCNNVPSLADLSWGMIRRLHIIPFDRTFTEEEDDKELFYRIWNNEMSGVLNHAITGWHRLQKRGHFELPEAMLNAQRDWLTQANPFEGFFEDMCKPDAHSTCLLADLYTAFCSWAQASGYTRLQQKGTIKRNIVHKGYTVKRRNRGQTILGLRLRKPGII